MSHIDPYQVPEADLDQPAQPGDATLVAPKSVPIGHGWRWIAGGFQQHVRKNIGPWIFTMIIGLIMMIGISLIPLVGQLFIMLTTYVWIGGFLIGCHDQDNGGRFDIQHLFAGFSSDKKTQLILLSLLVFTANMLVMFAAIGSIYFDMLMGSNEANEAFASSLNDPFQILIPVLTAILILIPLTATAMLATPLILFNKLPITQALKMSFSGLLKNLLPFFAYAILVFILYIVSIIPLALGLLIFIPTIMASLYVCYKDIFLQQAS